MQDSLSGHAAARGEQPARHRHSRHVPVAPAQPVCSVSPAQPASPHGPSAASVFRVPSTAGVSPWPRHSQGVPAAPPRFPASPSCVMEQTSPGQGRCLLPRSSLTNRSQPWPGVALVSGLFEPIRRGSLGCRIWVQLLCPSSALPSSWQVLHCRLREAFVQFPRDARG